VNVKILYQDAQCNDKDHMHSILLSSVGVWLCHIFLHDLIKGIIFAKYYWTWNACSDFLYNFCLKHFSL